jgi:anti-sigma B factor antagonist
LPDPTGEFRISRQRSGEVLVLALSGELDLDIAFLKSEVQDALDTDAEKIVLDLDGLDFIGSRGIGALLHLNVMSRRDGHRLAFRGARGQVARVFQITGVDTLL